MFGSLLCSSHHEKEDQTDEQQDEESTKTSSNKHHEEIQKHLSPSPPPAIGMRQLLLTCAELLSKTDFTSASKLITILSSKSSPYGDSTQRLVHQFTKSLSLRLNQLLFTYAAASSNDILLQYYASYLSLNQITPFIRFAQLTANQAILEAMEGEEAIHILDFNIMQGVQWPPFMQAIVERCSHTLNPLPMLRITGTGSDLNDLNRTGDRLLKFAQSLGLSFDFHPLLGSDHQSVFHSLSNLTIFPHEALAVNSVFYMHKLLKDDYNDLCFFLQKIKSLNPKIMTLAEREANHNHPLFIHRFEEALDHYTAIFDSLEATLPPNSKERLCVEQIWFGKEIEDIVGVLEEDNFKKRETRHERFEYWEFMLRSCGFSNVPLSQFAMSQAKLLLRLHYPSEGYQFQILNKCFLLGWQTRPLFSVSSWR